MTVITESEFTLYLLNALLITFIHPWIPRSGRSYEKFFRKEQQYTWWIPPSLKSLSLYVLMTNFCLAVASINYLYNNRNPSVVNHDNEYYISIESMWLTIIILKSLWHYTLLTYYNQQLGLIIALIASAIQSLIVISVIILLGIRKEWFSLAFMLPTTFFYLAAVGWTHTVWHKVYHHVQ